MITWAADRLLPGLAQALIVSAVVWLAHARTRLHISRVTAAQTRELTESKMPGGDGDAP